MITVTFPLNDYEQLQRDGFFADIKEHGFYEGSHAFFVIEPTDLEYYLEEFVSIVGHTSFDYQPKIDVVEETNAGLRVMVDVQDRAAMREALITGNFEFLKNFLFFTTRKSRVIAVRK